MMALYDLFASGDRLAIFGTSGDPGFVGAAVHGSSIRVQTFQSVPEPEADNDEMATNLFLEKRCSLADRLGLAACKPRF
jgi:hypothetical protein